VTDFGPNSFCIAAMAWICSSSSSNSKATSQQQLSWIDNYHRHSTSLSFRNIYRR
jgi:hypothetical protein